MNKFSFIRFYLFILIHTFGSYLFYKGFLPNSGDTIPNTKNHHASNLNYSKLNNPSWPPSKYNRMIFILIDALRADFVFTDNQQENFIPFLRNKINENKTFSYISVGNSPTVTMPRIKGITSGTIPNFHDVLMNAASTEFLEDNIISCFKRKSFKITFFGDDTWLKLFPMNFVRSDGTQSFFVNDYTEVDNNVTRHLSQELDQNDWDVMILHYLGLDHIGHTVGPFNPLISHKLLEMDSIIERIYKSIKNFDSIHGTNSLVLITGDHGMSNAGSHGGASKEELNTPCIFLSNSNNGEMFKGISIKQVDLAVTLAILFGVEIPRNSIGKPIPLINKLYNAKHIRDINKHVACQLHDVATARKLDIDSLRLLKKVCDGEKSDIDEIDEISKILASSSAEYDNTYMIYGLSMMVISMLMAILFICYLKQDSTSNNLNCIFPVFGLVVWIVSLASSSLIEEEQYLHYYFVTSFVLGLTLKYFKNLSMPHVILFLMLLRFLRVWNRTGVKWSGMEDFEDYLNQHPVLLLVLIFTGTCFVILLCGRQQTFSTLCILIILSLALLFFKTCSFGYLKLDVCTKTSKLYSARIVYIFSFLLIVFQKESRTSKISWIFLSLLLLKTTNFPWFCLVVILEHIFTTRMLPELKLQKEVNVTAYFYLYYGLGKLSYFAQGNSNNFATVDISSGIIGLTRYDPIVSSFISYIGTYCANFLWYLSLKGSLHCCMVRNIGSYICIYQMFQLTFFCFIVYFMRYHLFIWSVFAPKYLYMAIESLVNVLVVFPLFYFL